MKKAFTIIVTLALVSTAVLTHSAGIAASVDIGVIDKVKNYVMPTVIKDINEFEIGKIEFDKGYVDNLNLNFGIKDLNSI